MRCATLRTVRHTVRSTHLPTVGAEGLALVALCAYPFSVANAGAVRAHLRTIGALRRCTANRGDGRCDGDNFGLNADLVGASSDTSVTLFAQKHDPRTTLAHTTGKGEESGGQGREGFLFIYCEGTCSPQFSPQRTESGHGRGQLLITSLTAHTVAEWEPACACRAILPRQPNRKAWASAAQETRTQNVLALCWRRSSKAARPELLPSR